MTITEIPNFLKLSFLNEFNEESNIFSEFNGLS